MFYPMVCAKGTLAEQLADQHKEKINDIIKIVDELPIKHARILLILTEEKIAKKVYDEVAEMKVDYFS